MMKRHIFFHLSAFLCVLAGLLAACADDLDKSGQGSIVDDSNLVETRLAINVTAMSTNVETRADANDKLGEITPEEKQGTAAERKIDNIWVFQFDAATEKLLITPRYYDISDKDTIPDETTGLYADVLLKPDVASIVYVVANTGSSTWARNAQKFATLTALKEQALPNPGYKAVNVGEEPTDLSLPMEGGAENVTPTKGRTINVKVTRMYAKMEIYIEDFPKTLVFVGVDVARIPHYCRVGTLATADPSDAATYPITSGSDWNTCPFSPGTKDSDGKYTGKMVIYLPENLQGRTTNSSADAARKTEDAPNDNALRVDFVANYVDIFTGEELERGRHYRVYPGANNYNDYNIKRNFIYRVKLNIYTDLYDYDVPSSNCFVVKPDQQLAFLPYYRTEEGGGYKFTDYLDAEGDDESKKINNSDNKLENVKIIWQTKDAIGDNSKGDLVWIDRLSEADDEYHRKIHVKTGKEGNALIAAYNKAGDIIWSWHIWVTDNDPANIGNAIVYSTYAWNEQGILKDVRVPGYAIMACNLGALKYEPDNEDTVDPATHGMLYQWGRKDPFPPARSGNDAEYNDTYTGHHYDNDNRTVVGKSGKELTDKLFHSIAGGTYAKTFADAMKYSIQHPTVFLCGTNQAGAGEDHVRNTANYFNGGDWLPKGVHDNKLWGGLDPDESGDMKFHTYTHNNQACHIFDNYGSQKSIFDPCPSGWRVPPGDLWLGFTNTGYNPSRYEQINTATEVKYDAHGKALGGSGMYMYMTDWRKGVTSFFPTQGTRVPDGTILRTGSCGNYHNATTDERDRVNILHIHRSPSLFRVFETTYYMYYVKSVGGPIRCVRDHK